MQFFQSYPMYQMISLLVMVGGIDAFSHCNSHSQSSIHEFSFRRTTFTPPIGKFQTFSYLPNTSLELRAILEENNEDELAESGQNSTDSAVASTAVLSADKNNWVSQAVLSEGAMIMDFELKEHKPLGCTVEESAAEEDDGSNPVFIAKVTEGGNAEKAGLQVGDCIIGLSGIFDELEDVSEQGLTRVQSLVSGRYPEKPLSMRVLRGTKVLERHESYLVTLCTLPGGNDDDLNSCLDAIMENDYDSVDSSKNGACEDEEGECMLDTMFGAWGDEIFENVPKTDSKSESQTQAELEIEKKKKDANARPWASRSSPSGTYVRDPTTGKMKNIG